MQTSDQLPIKIEAFLHPLRQETEVVLVEEGATVEELFGKHAAPTVHVWIGTYCVPRELWKHVRPKAGVTLTVRLMASGSSNGDSNKGLRTALQIVVLVAAIYVSGPAGGTYGPYLGAFIAGAGGYAVNALVPPPTPQTPLTGDSFNRLRAITGTQNQVNPFGVVPRVYGKHRIFPPYAARAFTEHVGDDAYLRVLFCLGYGPLNVTELKIGDTSIDAYQDLDYEVSDTPTIFRTNVVEEVLSVPVTDNAPLYDPPFKEVVRTSPESTTEISFDLIFPQGLGSTADDPPNVQQVYVYYLVEYRAVGDPGPWSNVRDADGVQMSGFFTDVKEFNPSTPPAYVPDPDLYFWVSAHSLRTLRTSLRWEVAAGQYDVKITPVLKTVEDEGKQSVDGHLPQFDDQFYYTSVLSLMRYVRDSDITVIPGLTYLAMRIRATDQLNGVLDTVNCIAESILPVWDGATFNDEATHNPAWIFLNIACGNATERALDTSRFDLEALKDWADECDAAGREYNAVIDTPTTVFALMRDVAAVGRASYANRNGKHTVVRDIAGLTPTQVFTPRNSWGFSAKRGFSENPHALRVRYVSPDKGYQQDEFIVYDDGYSALDAEKFEVLELRGVTIREQAFKEARYQLASRRLRAETLLLSTDVENLACARGDLVQVQHDSIAVGLASGRVKAINGSDVLLDTQVSMEAGGLYGIRFRLADGSQELVAVVTAEGDAERVSLAAPVAGLAAGDLFTFGEYGLETVACKVNRITPREDFTAQLTLVQEAPDVYLADVAIDDDGESEIPEYNPELPPTPRVYLDRSDESVLLAASDGSLQSRIVAYYGFFSGSKQKVPVTVEGQYQEEGSGLWIPVPQVPARAGQISFLPVVDGDTYVLRLRSVSADGSASPWTADITHTVIGKTTPPPDVTSLFINGQTLNWGYPTKPRDFAGFEVRYHAGVNDTWDDAIAAHSGLVAGPPFLMQNVPAGQRTIMVKGIDQSGNESENAAVLITDFGDPIVANVAELYDFQAAGYPGTVTNGSITAGELAADGASLFWDAGDTSLFWATDGTTLFWGGEFLEMVYEFSFTPDAEMAGVGTSLVCEPEVTAQSWSMEFRLQGGSFFWAADDASLFWGDDTADFWDEDVGEWQPWPGRLENITRQQYDFRITTSAGFTQGVIGALDLIVDMPDIVDVLADVAISASGTRLPLTKTFRVIKNVNATLQDDGGTARTVEIIDKEIDGPLMATPDAAHVWVDGTIDATVQGY